MASTRFAGLVLASLFTLTALGCGSDSKTPTAPSPPPLAQIAGDWSGTFESQNWALRSFVMKLTQVGSRIDGTWASDPWTGTINGTVDAQNFTGQMTLNSPGTFGTCSGTASVSGPAGGATVRWTSPGVSGNCTNLPIAVVINVQRR